nr:PBP1A family penicillin-binding protein [Kordiimonas marina]
MPDLDNPPLPGETDPAVIVKASNGATLVRTGPIYGDWVAFREIPDSMVHAIVAVEDRHFFEHVGIDFRGLARAVLTNLRAGGVRAGGSTLTQQLAKNLFLSSHRTIKRKAQELLLALWLEQKFTKNQILTLYLNRVYFGGGAYGIDAASRKFFGHSARTLSITESAMLAGLVKSPSRLAPHINPDGAWERAKVVLDTMVETGVLTPSAAIKLKKEPPHIVSAVAGRDVRYFTDWVTGEAYRLLPKAAGQSLIIYTTLDPAAQRAATLALDRGLKTEGAKHHATEGAIVSLDLDGAVRAMVGGEDYAKSQFNRATQALRQPGSAFKLFAYLTALEAGIEPDDKFDDTPIMINGWAPKNYDNKFRGEMTMKDAFAHSINTIAVQIAEKVGLDNVVAMAHRLGITTPVQPVPSLPLGSEEIHLTDLASAYDAVANGGFRAEAYSIVEITSLEGEVLYRRAPTPLVPVLARPIVDKMVELLTAVVRSGTGRHAAIDRPIAGKTGTSQDSRDALFVGFTSDLTTAVWVGNDDGSPMKWVTGGGLPARIWADYMLDAHIGHPVRPLLADAGMYDAAAKTAEQVPPPQKKKKKKGFFSRLFGGD